jgi:molybdenum cofactor guanylyltransferase
MSAERDVDLAAIVLAGGHSRRMGRDKALLAFPPIPGRTVVEHIVAQLGSRVGRVLVSGGDPARYARIGLEVVPDREPDQGPMMAVASALARSDRELNLVVACDMPELPLALVDRLLAAARAGAEIAVPVTAEGHYEPLFAVYRRAILDRLDAAPARGSRGLRAVYPECDTRPVRLGAGERLVNMNTPEEYEAIVRAARRS